MKSLLLALCLVALATAAPPQDEAPADPPAAEEAPATADAAAEAAPVAADAAAAPADTCRACPEVSVQHYDAKQCQEVIDREKDSCCPVAYECPEPTAYVNTPTTCMFKGVSYNIGDVVPVPGPCRKECRCTKPISDTYPAEIVCDQTECPTSNIDVKPGCRLLFSVDQCCAIGVECGEEILNPDPAVLDTTALRKPDCTVQGFNYFIGDVMPIPTAPCQHCVCAEGFDSSGYGPGCTTIDCGLGYKYTERLKNGCVPLYSAGLCCPTDWVCPDGNIIVNIPDPAFANVTTNYCEMGNIRAPAGRSVATTSCNVNCVCNTPPDFTCVAYPTCEIALQDLHSGILP